MFLEFRVSISVSKLVNSVLMDCSVLMRKWDSLMATASREEVESYNSIIIPLFVELISNYAFVQN